MSGGGGGGAKGYTCSYLLDFGFAATMTSVRNEKHILFLALGIDAFFIRWYCDARVPT